MFYVIRHASWYSANFFNFFFFFCWASLVYLSAEAVFILIKHNSHFKKRASKQLALAGRKGRADLHLVMDYLLYPAGVEI